MPTQPQLTEEQKQRIRGIFQNSPQKSAIQNVASKLRNVQSESDRPRPSFRLSEDEMPNGALGVNDKGLPYYGEGFHGWVRKTYGDLFDPAKRLLNPDEDDWTQYGKYAQQSTQKLERMNWADWGEKVFGLSSKEAGNILASTFGAGAINKENLQEKVDSGEMSQTAANLQHTGEGIAAAANVTKDFGQNLLWGGLSILGITDTGVRKIMAVRLGIDELADKYGADTQKKFFSNIPGDNVAGRAGRDVGAFLDAALQYGNTIGIAKDVITLAKHGVSLEDVKEASYKYRRGSSGIYTLAYDEERRRQFVRRTEAGEDAGLVAAELAAPGLEFSGSILGDPATYLGLSIFKPKIAATPIKLFGKEVKFLGNVPRIQFEKIGKIPTFGELVPILNVGQVRYETEAAAHFMDAVDPNVPRLLKQAFESGNGDEAIAAMDNAAQQSAKLVNMLTSSDPKEVEAASKMLYKTTSYTASGKVKLMARDVSLIIDMVFSGAKGNIDETLETLQDMRLMRGGLTETERLNAGKRLMLKNRVLADGSTIGHGNALFSEAGYKTGEMLNRLNPERLEEIFLKNAGQPLELQKDLYKMLDDAFQEVFPSVDEMAKAKALSKGGDLKKELQAASDNLKKMLSTTTDKTFIARAKSEVARAEQALAKNEQYAKRYDALPNKVKAISAIHAKTSKIVGLSTGMQVNLFMRWSPGYFARNIWGQGAGIAVEMGLGRALRTSAHGWFKPILSMLTGGKIDPAQAHIAGRAAQAVEMLDVSPHAFLQGIGMAEKEGGQFLKAAQNSEQMASTDILVDTLMDEIHKALPAVLSGDGSLDTFVKQGKLTDKQALVLSNLLKETNGNTRKAINRFRAVFSDEGLEVWRNIPLPQGMTEILLKSGDLEEVLRLQKEAKSMEEFDAVMDIVNNIYQTVKKNAANEVPTLDSKAQSMMGDTVDNVIDNFNNGMASEADADYITRVAQGWQNVESRLDETVRELTIQLEKASDKNGVEYVNFKNKLKQLRTEARNRMNIKNSVNQMRWRMIDSLTGVHHDTGKPVPILTTKQIWEQFKVGDVFDITDDFPNAPASVQEAKSQIHRATDYWISDFWRDTNMQLHDDSLAELRSWAMANGTTLEEMASPHNFANDPFQLLERAYAEALKIEELRPNAYQKLSAPPFKGATLDDMLIVEGQLDFAGKKFDKKYVMNAVNAERKAQGLEKYATYKDVPWEDVQKVMRSRMGNFTTPAEVVKKVNADKAAREKRALEALKNVDSETPLRDMPEIVQNYFETVAKRMMDELHGGGVEKGVSGKMSTQLDMLGEAKPLRGRIGSTNIGWWKKASGEGMNRKSIDAALEKVAGGKFKNDTANIQRVKDMIFQRMRYGDSELGIPPDLYMLQNMGADKKTLKEALADFNEMTRNNFSLQEAIDASSPSDEVLRASSDMPIYNDKGQLLQPKRYTRIQDIPEDVVKGVIEPKRLPPPMNDEWITTARAYAENMDGFVQDAVKWHEDVKANWGNFDDAGSLPDDIEDVLSGWQTTVDGRMQYVKDKAMVIGQLKRDALLHDYNKTYADVALGYLMPFSYWHTRTYLRWTERLVDNPKIAGNYLAYRRNMERQHSEMPDWWRQNVGVSVPGINGGNPVFMNLEATINPLNGLTGMDFNDPYKRVDWLSRTVDDMGKMGPAFAAPLNWAMSLYLYKKGEDEASKRWLGRFFPATTQIKGALTKAGADINLGPFVKHNEIDPFVNMTSDGLDPYEINRVNRMLSQIVENETDPQKQALLATQAVDAARTHEGPLWDEARIKANQDRYAGNMASFVLGVGFKPRTEEDMKIDSFYGEYFKLLKLRDTMTTEEYRESWDRLRTDYPFADALIIGKKSDPERDSAFSYNVLGRIPPGQMTGLMETVGLTREDINRFYADKGDMSSWTEGDQKRFMAAVVDLSAVLQMPPETTRQEWTSVKGDYTEMRDAIAEQMGDKDIWEKVDEYYALKNEARHLGNEYLADHPEVSQALNMQTQMTMSNQTLYKYYGSINTLQAYYNGEMRKQLEDKYGAGIYEKYNFYLSILDQKQKNAYLKANPDLKAFTKEKKVLANEVNRQVVDNTLRLPSAPDFQYRSDLADPSGAQSRMIQNLNTPSYQTVDPNLIWDNSSPALQELMVGYWQNGDELPNLAYTSLDYIAEQYGISGQEALQLVGIMINQ